MRTVTRDKVGFITNINLISIVSGDVVAWLAQHTSHIFSVYDETCCFSFLRVLADAIGSLSGCRWNNPPPAPLAFLAVSLTSPLSISSAALLFNNYNNKKIQKIFLINSIVDDILHVVQYLRVGVYQGQQLHQIGQLEMKCFNCN